MGTETQTWRNTYCLIGRTEVRGKAWHFDPSLQGDEGNHYEGFIPVEDVRRRLFNWTADKAPLYRMAMDEDGVGAVEIPNRFGLFRSDTGDCLNVVTNAYEVHQYDDVLLGTVATLLDVADGELGIASAGLLSKGGTAWVQVEPPEGVTVGGDEMYPFLAAATSHNGDYATSYRAGVLRIVCENTLAAGMDDRRSNGKYAGDVVRFKHTANSQMSIAEARATLGIVFQMRDDFAAEVEALLSVEVSADRFDELDRLLFKAPKADDGGDPSEVQVTNWNERRDERFSMFRSDPRVAPWTGTGWGFVQTANTWAQHKANVRGDRAERNQHKFLSGEFASLDRAAARLVLADA
jgi:phage/plasmid-like protein (TIGR03299 family)